MYAVALCLYELGEVMEVDVDYTTPGKTEDY